VWDDTTTRIAYHRLLHNIPDDIAGLGPRPNDADTARQWRQLMLRTLEDRCWLTDRHHQPDTPPIVRSPAELVERRAELEQLMLTAPPIDAPSSSGSPAPSLARANCTTS
jgi:hypothetical protein